MNKKIKLLKFQLSTAILLLVVILISGFFIFGPELTEFARALSPNYSKVVGDNLDVGDWNNLPSDFVAKSGDTMSGPLTLSADPVLPMQAATKQYVDNARGGGDIFINWGRRDCPAGVTATLYTGYAFSSKSNQNGGGTEPTCVRDSVLPSGAAATLSDELYPLGIGAVSSYLSPAMIAATNKEVGCAACYVENSTCYEQVGRTDCYAGFNVEYSGYMFGGITFASPAYLIEANRKCVNLNFDISTPNNNNYGAVWYGTTINRDGDGVGLLYPDGGWLQCSVCCGG
jgi:hypothetical protein